MDVPVAPVLVRAPVLRVRAQVLFRSALVLCGTAAAVIGMEPVISVGEIGHGARAQTFLIALPASELQGVDDLVLRRRKRLERQAALLDEKGGDGHLALAVLDRFVPNIADMIAFGKRRAECAVERPQEIRVGIVIVQRHLPPAGLADLPFRWMDSEHDVGINACPDGNARFFGLFFAPSDPCPADLRPRGRDPAQRPVSLGFDRQSLIIRMSNDRFHVMQETGMPFSRFTRHDDPSPLVLTVGQADRRSLFCPILHLSGRGRALCSLR